MEDGPFRIQTWLLINLSLGAIIKMFDGLDGWSVSPVTQGDVKESAARSGYKLINTDVEPEEGELFLASPVQTFLWINLALFARGP
jgi:hypothetical protein